MSKYSQIITSVLLFSAFQSHAIVNTESAIQSFNKMGFNGKLNVELQGSSGNSETSEIAADAAIGWNTNSSKSILLIGREFGRSNKVTDTDNSFIYFKHLYQAAILPTNYQLSLFAQREQDDFRDIQARTVLGHGLRATINTQNLIELSFMQEEVASTVTGDADRSNTRLNVMWDFSYQLNQQIKFRNTAYYQPNVENFSDKQAINQAALMIDINEHLKVDLYHKLTHFSVPIGDAKSTDTSYGTRFSYTF